MGFFDMFRKNKKDSNINVTERKNSALHDAAAAIAFAEAGEHDTAYQMIDKSVGRNMMLVIGREDSFSTSLIEYSLGMAQRLDYKIFAMNVSDTPLSLTADKREEASEHFRLNCKQNIASFQQLAAEKGLGFEHGIEISRQETAIDKLHAQFPGMRYVLTDPDPETVQSTNGQKVIPVFDLSCYQGAAA